ncbi:MAG: hypothetical protein EOQ50_16780 [Mesorhizobium sp.]|uniref:hypothetical protein n=2 Tax=Mesorhizobium sp. TaxID=1871066 RepID=UPI000FE916EE|nr:hypothetical protein [Mesorhizobium sp.]RWB73357.1 MAG: hypothetical protein EOQ50_16780 [Mesorhizobium sp.]
MFEALSRAAWHGTKAIAKLHFASFQHLYRGRRGAAVDLEMHTRIGSKEFGESRNQRSNIDTFGDRDVVWHNITALNGLGWDLAEVAAS